MSEEDFMLIYIYFNFFRFILMSKLKYFAQKNFIKRRRRHTDSGEYTLSILSAKRELNNETVGLSEQHRCVLPSKSFQTSLSINPSTFTQRHNGESLEKNKISSQDFSESVVYFLHLGLIIQIKLPKVPNFEWLLSTFIEAFDIPKSHSLIFYSKFPNTSFCQVRCIKLDIILINQRHYILI